MHMLTRISTRAPQHLDKKEIQAKTQTMVTELDELQNLLYAENRHALLVVLQGPDAGGKDGLIRKIFGHLNPQGVRVQSFKEPTEEELAHDFLWRIHQHVPRRGMIQVFNRSHYEDVLITRVHGLIDEETAKARFRAINDFENLLVRHNNTRVLKFYLHISREEQQERLEERLHNPRKMWKYNPSDFKEAARWDDYHRMYEDVFQACSVVPWTIVPADQNWYKEFVVAEKVLTTLRALDMKYPELAQ